MPARAIWTGTLKLATSAIPVKLYSAVEDRSVHFHILAGRTKERVKQRMVDPETDEEVPREEIRKGVEVEPGTFVVVDDKDLEKLAPAPSDDMEVIRFVPPDRITHQWYERPYYLGPDKDSASYFAIARAIASKEMIGIVRWTMRHKRYAGALRAEGDYLNLITLRSAEEVLSSTELPKAGGRAPDEREIKMAEQLVAALQDEFDPAAFRDEYRERVFQLIEAKAKGRKPKLQVMPKPREAGSLMEALVASLEKSKPKRRKSVA